MPQKFAQFGSSVVIGLFRLRRIYERSADVRDKKLCTGLRRERRSVKNLYREGDNEGESRGYPRASPRKVENSKGGP